MSHVQSNDRPGNAFWWVSLLLALLFGFVTAKAIQHNPLYSDRDAYGISKYRFIEECKAELEQPNNLKLNLQGQEIPLQTLLMQSQQLRQGETVVVRTTATSAQLVSGVAPMPAPNAAPNTTATANRLGLQVPVDIAVKSGSGERVLGPARMLCTYNPATHRAEVVLGAGG